MKIDIQGNTEGIIAGFVGKNQHGTLSALISCILIVLYNVAIVVSTQIFSIWHLIGSDKL